MAANADPSGSGTGGNADPSASERRTGVWVAVGLLILAFGFTVALTIKPFVDHSNPFWFVGLLVIFGAALSLIAVAFRWLGLANRDEAFGLPTGSVRSLLAIGVMVLFAVFGLVAVTVDEGNFTNRVADQPLASAVAPAASAALDAEVKRYERQGMVAVVESAGAASAALKLYRIDRVKPTETSDMQKQVLTALVTLLTSIVSFYFGSRTSEAARGAKDKGDTGGGNSKPTTVALASVDADLKTLDEAITAGRARLTALQSEPASEGHEQALAAVLAQLTTESPAIDADRVKLTSLVADVRNGGAQATTIDAPLAALRQRVDAFAQRLTDAESLIAKG